MEWLLLIIPVSAILLLTFAFNAKIVLWEYLVVFLIPIIAIIVLKQVSVGSQTADTEYWNNYVTSATYYEAYDEWIQQTCTRCDSDDNCTSYDCSHCDRHSARWEYQTNKSTKYSITQSKFKSLSNLWANKKFVDLGRNDFSYTCDDDGDKYVTKFDNNLDNLIPITSTHSYENRTQATVNVFNFQEVDSASIADYKLFEYPKKYNREKFDHIIGVNDPKAERILRTKNALVGSSKQLNMMIVVMKNQPRLAGSLQEAYWKGGNKNEFIVIIGTDKSNNITWTKIVSWTTNEKLKIEVRDHIIGMKYNIPSIAKYIADEVPNKFVRREFEEFDYIDVPITTKALLLGGLIILLLTIGLSIFVVVNDHER